MNRNELFDSILKDVDRIEDDDKLEAEDEQFFKPRPPKQPSQVYSIRVPVERLEQLRKLAEQRHVAPSALIREWVVERLDTEIGRPSVRQVAERVSWEGDDAIDPKLLKTVVEIIASAVTKALKETEKIERRDRCD